jgi:hypothetical protein
VKYAPSKKPGCPRHGSSSPGPVVSEHCDGVVLRRPCSAICRRASGTSSKSPIRAWCTGRTGFSPPLCRVLQRLHHECHRLQAARQQDFAVSLGADRRSVSNDRRSHASQQTASLFDHLVSSARSDCGKVTPRVLAVFRGMTKASRRHGRAAQYGGQTQWP